MTKKLRIGIILGIVFIIAYSIISGSGPSEVEQSSDPESREVLNTSQDSSDINLQAPLEDVGADPGESISGEYLDYDQALLSRASEGEVVIFFAASWCPSCQALDRDIKGNLESIPGSVTLLKADYDTEIELRKAYGVTTQHTLVQVDSQGNQIAKWSGGSTLEGVLKQIQ
jgi:thiol-disulfide isomerase/thioredoxin